MPEQRRHLANKYEDIVNLPGAGAYFGGFPRSLWIAQQYVTYYHDIFCLSNRRYKIPMGTPSVVVAVVIVVVVVDL